MLTTPFPIGIPLTVSHNVLAMRSEPQPNAEQVSQALLGETVLLCEIEGEYGLIESEDFYRGWALLSHLRPQTVAPSHLLICAPFAPLLASPSLTAERLTMGVFGTRLALAPSPQNESPYPAVVLPDGRAAYVERAKTEPLLPRPAFHGETLCQIGREFLGTPYLWGGGSPFGFDCSGIVQSLFRYFGVLLPRDAYLQAESPLLSPLGAETPWQAGDLLFFCGDRDPRGRGVTHVGIATDNASFLHSCGKEGVILTPRSDPYYARTFRKAMRLK